MKDRIFPKILPYISHFNKTHGLLLINGIAIFNIGQNFRQNRGTNKIENTCHQERSRVKITLYKRTGNTHQIVHGKNVYKGRIFQERDGFISQRRNDVFHYLRQDNMPHCLFVGKAEHFRPLILPLADGLDPAAEYFCKIRRIVSYKGKYSRREIADLQIKIKGSP